MGMKILKRNYPVYTLDNLPEITSDFFIWKGQKVYAGSIFARPIEGTPFVHFAFFRGLFDHKGQKRRLMIENNEDGVEAVYWGDFLPRNPEYCRVVEHLLDSSKIEMMMQRANTRVKETYNVIENNCEMFVNFCLFGKLDSLQSAKFLKLFQKYTDMSKKQKNEDRRELMLMIVSDLRETLNMSEDFSVKSLLDDLDKD